MSRDPRRWLVVGSAVVMLIGTLYGFGLLGTPVESSIGGSLAANATLLAPATPAFSIWSLIYLGLFSFTIWQVLPFSRHSARTDAVAALAALSMVLNGAWLMVVQAGWIWASVVIIFALVFTLGIIARLLASKPAASRAEAVLLDGTFGLYLGWTSVATLANVTAALVASGLPAVGSNAEPWAPAVLALGAVLGILLARTMGGRLTIAAAMAWGLGWIAVGRFTGEPASALTGAAAAVAAAIVIAAAVLVRLRTARVPSRQPLAAAGRA
ncbi:hypothetical protein [Propionicimonas sp.]|uniref:hypothetical protein n=1 Tax=Propionicimonas sp. TaxID=1955623 RepID=UPI00181E5882|nr:hypothetical protein [Propionicimonas sp.]MBU3976860.1 tryptophan-rich sensory protein [Actinomycetota bacterium]MBA3019549.1 tryptophan-rich sensory protein [Propionicimonas sp.]MBU3986955.1 tryptophan-rich sensory protein [Actinomycetota bacterium]MBU4006867.1 tryptophan-rich sensory protein [Actinomycetota bacterium]MBU4065567.1 tryptophan-rich sensory protein [Actinomycetota bacterium]